MEEVVEPDPCGAPWNSNREDLIYHAEIRAQNFDHCSGTLNSNRRRTQPRSADAGQPRLMENQFMSSRRTDIGAHSGTTTTERSGPVR